MTQETLTDLCKRLEHFETPEWAARAILKKEILTRNVVDPCTGSGILHEAALVAGYAPISYDIYLWPAFAQNTRHMDFLKLPSFDFSDTTVFMNPPFSLAEQFVKKSLEIGARKIVCFQRFAWWESRKRRDFWKKYPPSRVWVCGDRADCWRNDIPKSERKSSTPTAHAWFVWEEGHSGPPLLGHIWKDD